MQFPEQPHKLQLATRNAAPIQNPQLIPPATGLEISDIYFILFRHKWKIIICSLLGVAAALAFYKLQPPPYQSEAKLFIRYVMDSRAAGPAGDDARVKSIDSHGETIISSELEIMTSLDLAGQVVDAIGPEKIINLVGDGNDRARAINAVSKSLEAEAGLHSSVVHLYFRSSNKAIVQPVLREIIDRYLKKHVEIHRALGITGDFLTQETDRLRSRLAQTQEELREAQNKVGVASIEDAKKSYAEQISKLRQEIYTAEAEFAERSMVFKELTGKSAHVEEPEKAPALPPQDQIDDYRKITERLRFLRHKEQELLTEFTEENSRVKELRAQLDESIKAKQKIEEENPGLKSFEVTRPAQNQTALSVSSIDVNGESARLKALEAKIQTYHNQLDDMKSEASKVSQMEGTIQELRRRKELEESNYKYYSASLEQARIDEALGAGHVSNISEIQSPSPPSRDRSKSLKTMMILGVGGVAIGLAWAFAIEMVLDRTVKRPIDVERISKLPLFISIPRISSRERRHFAKKHSLASTAMDKADEAKSAANPAQLAKLHSDRKAPPQLLYHFHETLRDRLIAYFESINLIHKPKLVAVTGLSRRSGVTSVAAGLAQCLSETGEGNVLLVDMSGGQGSAQQFFKGQKVCGLDELLETRNNALIQEKLYVVQEGSNSENLSRNLPQRFTKLIPKLKASDFDYIIFDMPPVSQISVTPRLASFMDMVLLVIESEKTNRDVVERASALLAQSKTNVGAVLNKTRAYIPKVLYQDSLSET